MALEAKNIFFRYHRNQPWIFRDFSLRAERGERLAIFAPSGYGKTTLAMLLAGFLTPVKGQILLEDNPLPKKGICPVQLIFQHPENAVNPRWRMRHVLEEGGGSWKEMLDRFGIEEAWLDRFPRELSGGELQRFSVVRALSCGACYLICDEISTMLDVITQAQIWNAVLEEAVRRHMGIIAITHSMPLAERIATRIVSLQDCV